MLLLVGGLPPGPDRLPSNLVQYYDDEKKTWKILTSKLFSIYYFRGVGKIMQKVYLQNCAQPYIDWDIIIMYIQ